METTGNQRRSSSLVLLLLAAAAVHAHSDNSAGKKLIRRTSHGLARWDGTLPNRHEARLREAAAGSKGSWRRQLLAQKHKEPLPNGPSCPPLSKELLAKHAKDNTVIVSFSDGHHFKHFAPSWVEGVKRAGITYWYMAAMDPWASAALGALGVTQCFNAPIEVPSAEGYDNSWYDDRWSKMSWVKVHVIKAVYDLGFSVFYTDADSTWFKDPLPWIKTELSKWNIDIAVTLDEHRTANPVGDMGPEKETNIWRNMNAGTLYLAESKNGHEFLKRWLALEPDRNLGSDQDGLGVMIKGKDHWKGNASYPSATVDESKRVIYAAMMKEMRVGYLPVHLFSNAYSYTISKVHQKLQVSTPFHVHWVWTGRTPECKIQHMREAYQYADAPSWYGLPLSPSDHPNLYEYAKHPVVNTTQPLMLLSMDLGPALPMPDGYNTWRNDRTEDMIQFHLANVRQQLSQVYWGLLAAGGLGRTFIMPDFKCYCIKTGWGVDACRIDSERHTTFPYHCMLSDLFKTQKMLSEGINIPTDHNHQMTVYVRERNFLTHPRTPQEIKGSKLIVRPGPMLPTPNTGPPAGSLSGLKTITLSDGSKALDVPWPLTVEELKQVLSTVPGAPYRVVHLTNATQIVGRGFTDAKLWATFDTNIDKYATYWCCRPEDAQKKHNRPERETLHIVPYSRRSL